VLVKTADARGRKAICEVLMMTKAIAKLIQAEQSHQIPSQLQMGRDLGMSLLDQSLLTAVTAREIDPDDAYSYATDKKQFQKYVTDTSVLPKVEMTASIPAPQPAASA
jgi:twitching motility protein PilT